MSRSTRAIARKYCFSFVFCGVLCFAAAETILDRLAKLSANLSDSNGAGAISSFDSAMKDFGDISKGIDALTAQAEIVCAIDIIGEKEADGVHHLDTDWVLQLKSKADHGPLERRRERIQLEMRMTKGKWKITAMSNPGIFADLRVQ